MPSDLGEEDPVVPEGSVTGPITLEGFLHLSDHDVHDWLVNVGAGGMVFGNHLLRLFSLAFHHIVSGRLGRQEVNSRADNGREHRFENQRDTPAVVSWNIREPDHRTQHGQTANLEACPEEADHATSQVNRGDLADVLEAGHKSSSEAHEEPTCHEHGQVNGTALQDSRDNDDGISKEIDSTTANGISQR